MLGKEKIKSIYISILKFLGIDEGNLFYIAGSDKLPEPLEAEEENLLLEYNKSRQAAITQEITEISGAANAIK